MNSEVKEPAMQIPDADLKLLRIFETIVRCGGFCRGPVHTQHQRIEHQ